MHQRRKKAKTVVGFEMFGSVTQVPADHLSRLSFYLKCCTVGCGLPIPRHFDRRLLDYQNAHDLSPSLQCELIYHSLDTYNPQVLVDAKYILIDDQHKHIPKTAEHAFFRVDAIASEMSSSDANDDDNIISSFEYSSRKVMICTSRFLHEIYQKPMWASVEGPRHHQSSPQMTSTSRTTTNTKPRSPKTTDSSAIKSSSSLSSSSAVDPSPQSPTRIPCQ